MKNPIIKAATFTAGVANGDAAKKKTAEEAYERFKLQWMLSHGHTLKELICELEALRTEGDPCMSLEAVFADWEFGYGFGSEIWPCFEEFLDCEGREMEEINH